MIFCDLSSRKYIHVDKIKHAVKDYSNAALLFSENTCLKTNTVAGGGSCIKQGIRAILPKEHWPVLTQLQWVTTIFSVQMSGPFIVHAPRKQTPAQIFVQQVKKLLFLSHSPSLQKKKKDSQSCIISIFKV